MISLRSSTPSSRFGNDSSTRTDRRGFSNAPAETPPPTTVPFRSASMLLLDDVSTRERRSMPANMVPSTKSDCASVYETVRRSIQAASSSVFMDIDFIASEGTR